MDTNTKYEGTARYIRPAKPGEPDLGPLKELPGVWTNTVGDPDSYEEGPFFGRGWNMIALPFEGGATSRFGYRMLVNQYNETLKFLDLDGSVPNRGTNKALGTNTDQTIFAIDYEQSIAQLIAADSPQTKVVGKPGLPIHHEPGFMLHIKDRTTTIQEGELKIARLASIPHGNTVTAMGVVREIAGPPTIPNINGLPTGVNPDLANNPYLDPYRAFSGANAFKGVVQAAGFPGFDVVTPNGLLTVGLNGLTVKKTVELTFDTRFATGAVVNIPFIERQADATEMRSIFWIMDVEPVPVGEGKEPITKVLAYSQLIFLDFFPRPDGVPGLIRWPHVSINMMALQ